MHAHSCALPCTRLVRRSTRVQKYCSAGSDARQVQGPLVAVWGTVFAAWALGLPMLGSEVRPCPLSCAGFGCNPGYVLHCLGSLCWRACVCVRARGTRARVTRVRRVFQPAGGLHGHHLALHHVSVCMSVCVLACVYVRVRVGVCVCPWACRRVTPLAARTWLHM
jgi:hypothetical protein